MIIALTDGVGLTGFLSKGNIEQDERIKILSDFFRVQIEAFNARACGSVCRVIKTTGDGLFLSIDDEAANGNVFHDVLLSMKQAKEACKRLNGKIHLRSVIHYCPGTEIIDGDKLEFHSFAQPERKLRLDIDSLNSDVFGLEIIRIARIAGIAKGPFHLLTKGFVSAMTKHNTISGMKGKISEWGLSHPDDYTIDSEPIGLPLLKGFEAKNENFTVSFEEPYWVWEIDYD